MKELSYAIVFLLGVLLGVFGWEYFHECQKCDDVKEEIKQSVRTKSDTTKPDSNKVTKKSFKPQSKKIYPNLLKPGRTFRVYEDSLINNEVAINTRDTVNDDGTIESKEISYRLKVPLKIIDSVFIETTITKTIEKPVPQKGLFIGAEVGTNLKGFRLAPEIEYLDKKGYAYSYNYDVLNNLHSVGVKKKLKL